MKLFFIFLCLYNHPLIAQLVERMAVVEALAGLLRSLNQIWLGGQHFCKKICLLYTSPSPRDKRQSRMPSSA